jgi:hypothetical protein
MNFAVFGQENISIIGNSERRTNFDEEYFNYTVIYNTDIIGVQNNSRILLKTQEGCSQTDFKLKRDFYYDFKMSHNIFEISTVDSLNQLMDKYITLPFLETFTKSYFEDNYLVLILADYSDGNEFRNERIELNNGRYSFIMDHWYIVNETGWYLLCLYTALYILEIPKR